MTSVPSTETDPFPSVDPWVGWALTIICLMLGLLFVFGILSVNVGPLSGWVWLQILIAQALTALAVGGAARLSARKGNAAAGESDTAEGQPTT